MEEAFAELVRRELQPLHEKLDRISPVNLSLDQVATMVGLSRKTIQKKTADGSIPCQRVGRRVLYTRTAVEAWLKKLHKAGGRK